LGLVNYLIRPLILLASKRFGLLSLIFSTLIINALILYFIAEIIRIINIESLWSAFVASIVFTIINTILVNVLTISDKNSLYQRRIERLASKTKYKKIDVGSKGLIVIEIDGLSYQMIKKSINKGYLPSLKKLMQKEGYLLDHYDCGLPSQTSACQAGIMFGNNYDIPAFRWYDKKKGKLYVSSKDAAEINDRYSKSRGLLRGGSSIDNMMNGDAKKSLLTLADTDSKNFKKVHSNDLYLLMIDPNFFLKNIMLFLYEVLLEIFQGLKQKIKNTKPRLNRIKNYYPFIRAATTVLTREISVSLAILEIVRGTPALYMTFVGYDEVAHHSGPSSKDAFGVLKSLDHSIERIYNAVKSKGLFEYNFVIISDHGQSFGATFKQRYGYDLKEYIDKNTKNDITIAQAMGGDDGSVSINSLSNELGASPLDKNHKNYGKKTLNKTFETLNNMSDKRYRQNDKSAGQITVCGSGNIAHVYFNDKISKLSSSEIETLHPGLIKSLINHRGIGFVVVYNEKLEPILISKNGTINLNDSILKNKDILTNYGNSELRYSQIKKIAQFPSAGDLIVNSTVYKDGTVAAFEELIGSHGGVGGEQTDAFIFHQADIEVFETQNSTDMYKILNKSRP
jgi:predicted AlkP superfamily pyrophosphatase or phosphodiesterase